MMDAEGANCPYCGESVEVLLDRSGGTRQTFVEDCPICCRPWQVHAERDSTGQWYVELRTLDE